MMLVARLARQDHDELQNQIGPRDTHGFGYVGAYVCASKRKCDARRSVGSVQFPVTVGVWAIFVLLFVKLK